MRRLVFVVWPVYFAAAPMLWFFGLPPPLMAALKAGLFGVAAIATFAAVDTSTFPRGMIGPPGAVIVVLSASFALFQETSPYETWTGLYSVALPFIMLWAFWNLARLRDSMVSLVCSGAYFIAAVSVLILADKGGVISVVGPVQAAGQSIGSAGFARASTDWSNGVAPLVPFLAISLASSKPPRRTLNIFSMVAIVAGQIATGGRTGALLSIVSILAIIWAASGVLRRLIGLGVVALIITLPLVLYTTNLGDPPTPSSSGGIGETINELSTGRLELLTEGIQKAAERPITGYGFSSSALEHREGEIEVHSTWIRLILAGGFPFALASLALVFSAAAPVLAALRLAPGRDVFFDRLAGALVVAGGVVSSLVEPSAIVGAFHKSSVWWGVAGFAAGSRFVQAVRARMGVGPR